MLFVKCLENFLCEFIIDQIYWSVLSFYWCVIINPVLNCRPIRKKGFSRFGLYCTHWYNIRETDFQNQECSFKKFSTIRFVWQYLRIWKMKYYNASKMCILWQQLTKRNITESRADLSLSKKLCKSYKGGCFGLLK